MKRWALVFVLVVAAAAGCKKKQDGGTGGGSATKAGDAASAATSPDAAAAAALDAAPAPAIDAAEAAGAFALPADATVIAEADSKKADAGALGGDVTAHLADKVTAATEDATRHLDQVLVLSGTGSMIVEVGFALDDGSKYKDKGESLQTVGPLAPARPFQKDDAGAMLAFKGPLLYLTHWRTDESGDDLAVGQDGDAIVVWRSQTLDGEAQAWYEQARVKLAAGAKVTAK